MDKQPIFSLFAVGDPIPNQELYPVEVQWTTADMKPSDIDFDIKFSIMDRYTRKLIAETDPLTDDVRDNDPFYDRYPKYYFKQLEAWDDADVSHEPANWILIVPNELRLDVRIFEEGGGSFAQKTSVVRVKQKASPLYKATYYTNASTNPTINIKRQDAWEDLFDAPINSKNLEPNEYYSFIEILDYDVFFNGEKIKVSQYGTAPEDDLFMNDKETGEIFQLFVIDPTTNELNQKGVFTDTANGNVKYAYNVVNNYKTFHEITVRQVLKVNFDANGGTWKAGSTPEEQEFVHSVPLGENWGPITKVTVPDGENALTPPEPGLGEVSKEFVGWNIDPQATEGMDVASAEITEDTTFYAIYNDRAQGYAQIQYLDKDGKPIDAKYQVEGQSYPEKKEGTLDESINTEDITKPNFTGYQFNRIELSPVDANYTPDGKSMIKIYYDKLDDVIPGTAPESQQPNNKPDGYVTVNFDLDNKGTTTNETVFYVNPKAGKTNADLAEPTIKANTGYKVADPKWSPLFNTTTQITEDATYIAQYVTLDNVIPGTGNDKPDGYVTVKFDLDNKGTTEEETVYYVNPKATDITGVKAPNVKANTGYKFNSWDSGVQTAYTQDTTHKALYDTLENIIPGTDPTTGENNEQPAGYVEVKFDLDGKGTTEDETTYYVNPEAGLKLVDITKPKVTPNTGYKYTGWDKTDRELIGVDGLTVTAQYEEINAVIPGTDPDTQQPNKKPDGYVTVKFDLDNKGTTEEETVFYVNPKATDITGVTAPNVTANTGYKFNSWDSEVQTAYTQDTTHKALYDTIDDIIDVTDPENPPTKPEGYVTVSFLPGFGGTLEGTTEFYVNPTKVVDLTTKAPKVNVQSALIKYTGWSNPLKAQFENDTEITATYIAEISPIQGATVSPSPQQIAEGAKIADITITPEDTNATVTVENLPEGLEFNQTEKKITGTPVISNWANGETNRVITLPILITNSNGSKKLETASITVTRSDDVVPQTGTDKPIVPANYVKVAFADGKYGTIDAGQTKIYWVNPTIIVDLTGKTPSVTASENYKFTGWDKALTAKFAEETTITAQYKQKVVTEDPGDGDYVKVSFTTSKGSLNGTENYWVLRNEEVSFTAPEVQGLTNYEFKAWNPDLQTSYSNDTTHKAIFNYTGENIVPQPGTDKPDVPDNFVKVEFLEGDHGKLEGTTIYWVNPDANETLGNITKPTVNANEGYRHDGWDQEDTTPIGADGLTVTATYEQTIAGKVNELGGLSPETITVWVGGNIDWKQGVKAKDEANADTINALLANEKTTVTDKSNRDSAKAGSFAGTLEVKFEDGSSITVNNQLLVVKKTDDVVPQTDDKKPDVPDNFVEVKFLAGDHGSLEGTTIYWVNPDANKTLGNITKPTVKANEGYKHTGWDREDTTTIGADGLTVTAKYEQTTAGKVADLGGLSPETITVWVGGDIDWKTGVKAKDEANADTINALLANEKTTVTDKSNRDSAKAGSFAGTLEVKFEDGSIITVNNQLLVVKKTDDVVPQKPGEDKPDVPDNFVEVKFLPGEHGKLEGTTIYWVNPDANKTLGNITKPTVKANEGYRHTGWDREDTTTIGADGLTVTAKYEQTTAGKVNELGGLSPETITVWVGGDIDWKQGVKPATTDEANAEEINALLNAETATVTDKSNRDSDTAGSFAGTLEVKFEDGSIITVNNQLLVVKKTDDVVPQKPGEDKPDVPDNFVKVEFLPGEHGSLEGTTIYWINPDANKTLGNITKPTVKANEGYRHTGWDREDATPIGADGLTVTAKYEQTTAGKVNELGGLSPETITVWVGGEINWKQGVKPATTDEINLAEVKALLANDKTTVTDKSNRDSAKAGSFAGTLEVKFEDGSIITVNNQLLVVKKTDDVVPQKPGEDKPDVPDNFVEVKFLPGDHGSLEGTTIYWVNPEAKVTVNAPGVKVNDNWKHTGWTMSPTIEGATIGSELTAVTAKFTEATTITADYMEKVLTEEPTENAEKYAIVEFLADDQEPARGTLEGTTKFWVLKNTEVKITEPSVNVGENYKFTGWDKQVANMYSDDTRYTAQYQADSKIIVDPTTDEPLPGYVRLTFNATVDGRLGTAEGKQMKVLDVKKDTPYADEDLANAISDIHPVPVKTENGALVMDDEKVFDQWSPLVPTTGYVKTQEFTATYKVKEAESARAVIESEQRYDDPTDRQYVWGKIELAQGETAPRGTQVTMIDGNGNQIAGTKATYVNEDGTFEINLAGTNLQHGDKVYFIASEPNRADSEKGAELVLDLKGPEFSENFAITPDPYKYEVKVTGSATDDAGILRIFIENDRANGIIKEYTATDKDGLATEIEQNKTVDFSDGLYYLFRNSETVSVTSIDRLGNKTVVTKTFEQKKEPIKINVERPMIGDNFVNVKTDQGANITVEIQDSSRQVVATINAVQASDNYGGIMLTDDSGNEVVLERGYRVLVSAQSDTKTKNSVLQRVR